MKIIHSPLLPGLRVQIEQFYDKIIGVDFT